MELSCVAQLYDWGKLGSESLVAKLLQANKTNKIDEHIPYAELWVGTHAKGESCILSTGETLQNFIKKNPLSLGTVANVTHGDLPFLLKALSIQKCLSIQAHPNKELAYMLNQQYPSVYRDANHKPELAIAVEDFEVLCGFRPLDEIKDFLRNIPELHIVLSHSRISDFAQNPNKNNLKNLFTSLMNAPEKIVREALTTLLTRLRNSVDEIKESQLYSLVEMLNSQHPMDVGVFSVYFMNYIKLKPSEAVFIDASVPHAYLKGNCVEIMACSDNVIRAGLTTKFRDVTTLCSMLNYNSNTVSQMKFKGKLIDQYCTVYKPPVKEFAIIRISVPPSIEHVLPPHHGCSLILVIEGTGNSEQLSIRPGAVAFLPAHTEMRILVTTHLLLFQAFCNI